MAKKDYYAVLGVNREATVVEIRNAYRKIVTEHHPDVAKDKKMSVAVYREATEAYEVIGGAARREYDKDISTQQVVSLDETVKKAVKNYLDSLE